MSQHSGSRFDPLNISIRCLFLTALNTEVADFCHFTQVAKHLSLCSLLLLWSLCLFHSLSDSSVQRCHWAEILINIIMNSNHMQIVTRGLCIHCLTRYGMKYKVSLDAHLHAQCSRTVLVVNEERDKVIEGHQSYTVITILLYNICESEI